MSPSRDEAGRRYPVHHSSIEKDNRSILIFLTLCTKDRQPLLLDPLIHELLVTWWRKADRWLVGHYVILPDHLHLFCAPGCVPEQPLEPWVAYWKNGVARHWPKNKNGPIWQRDFWDTQLRHGESYGAKWEYVRHNPVRHGLAQSSEAWPYQGEVNLLDWHDP